MPQRLPQTPLSSRPTEGRAGTPCVSMRAPPQILRSASPSGMTVVASGGGYAAARLAGKPPPPTPRILRHAGEGRRPGISEPCGLRDCIPDQVRDDDAAANTEALLRPSCHRGTAKRCPGPQTLKKRTASISDRVRSRLCARPAGLAGNSGSF